MFAMANSDQLHRGHAKEWLILHILCLNVVFTSQAAGLKRPLLRYKKEMAIPLQLLVPDHNGAGSHFGIIISTAGPADCRPWLSGAHP